MIFPPISADQATSVEELREGYFAIPENTLTGVVCGFCTQTERKDGNRVQVRHASVAHVRYCFATNYEAEAEMRAEQHAELAWLRHAEGGWDPTGAYAAESLLTAGGLPALS